MKMQMDKPRLGLLENPRRMMLGRTPPTRTSQASRWAPITRAHADLQPQVLQSSHTPGPTPTPPSPSKAPNPSPLGVGGSRLSDKRKKLPPGGSGGPNSGGGGGPGYSKQLQVLAGHAAYTGLVGSVAIVGANAAHVDLFSMFHWSSGAQLMLALAMVMPLQVANLVLLGPDWSDWRLSDHSDNGPVSVHVVPSKPTTSFPLDSLDPQSLSSQPTIQPTIQPHHTPTSPAITPVSDGTPGPTTPQADAAPALPPGIRMVPAGTWGQPLRNPASSDPPTIQALRSAAYLAQSNYVQSNPTASVSPGAELAVAVVDSLSSEMLLRGLLITMAAGWTHERLYDAGWTDMVAIPEPLAGLYAAVATAAGNSGLLVDWNANAGPLLAPLDDVSRWVACGGLLALLTLLSVRRVARSAHKVAMMADITARIVESRQLQLKRDAARKATAAAAANSSSSSSSDSTSSMSASTASRPQADGMAQMGEGEAGSPSTSSKDASNNVPGHDTQPLASTSASSESSDSPSGAPRPDGETKPTGMAGSGVPSRPPKRQDRLPLDPARAGSSLTPLAHLSLASPRGGGTGAGNQGSLLALASSLTTGFGRGGGMDMVVLSSALQSSRDLLQGSTLSLVFVATGGNLAASFAASLLNQIVFSVLQRVGADRMRKRSAHMTKEIMEFERRMAAREAESAAAAAAAAAAAVNAATAAMELSSSQAGSASSTDSPAAASAAQVEAVAAGLDVLASGAEGVAAAAGQAHASASLDAASSPPAAPVPVTAMGRTLSLLDALVPEPAAPAKAKAAAKPKV